MKAAIRQRYGDLDVVRVVDVDEPVPGEGEVLVRVHTASVNRADIDYIQPRPQFIRAFVGIGGRRTRGSGRTSRAPSRRSGPGVTRFRPATACSATCCRSSMGSFAELVVDEGEGIPADPGGHRLRHRRDASARGGARAPGAAAAQRRDGQARRPGAGRRRERQRRAVRRPAREVDGRRGHRRLPDREGRVRAVARGGPRPRLPRGGLHPQPQRYDWIIASDSHHSIPARPRALRPGGQYATLGGGTRDILEAMVVGKLSRIGGSRMGRDHAVVEAVPRAGRQDAHRPRARREPSSPRSTAPSGSTRSARRCAGSTRARRRARS